MQSVKFYLALLSLTVLTEAFLLASAISTLMGAATITSSGKIISISPLRVEGRYIKDLFNRTVLLRGVNKVEFADDPDGIWMGNTYWSDVNVATELDAMKSWGINVIRCHMSVETWKYNIGPNSRHPSSPYCALPAREAIKRLVVMAAERGMYVVLDGYTVKSYWSGGSQDPLPYPPYQTSAGASEVIANEAEFIEWWTSIAQEFKDHPNVLFELWNEPNGDETAKSSWKNVAQQCINAIRSVGAQQIIIIQWNYGVWAGLASRTGEGVEWILDFNLTDPLGNILYSTHIYRIYGGCGLWQNLAEEKGTMYGYLYDDVKTAFQIEKIDWVGNTLNMPLFIGETGCALTWTSSELQKEIIAWNNTLTILNEWGIHYAAFWWREIGTFPLHYGPPNFNPTMSGQILKDALARASVKP